MSPMPDDDKSTECQTRSPQALRALAEAEERRRAAKPLPLPQEVDGRPGPEPTRYGDWEKKGIACDF